MNSSPLTVTCTHCRTQFRSRGASRGKWVKCPYCAKPVLVPTASAGSGMSSLNTPNLVKDVCAASAAYLFNILPELVNLPASQQYERLAAHFEAALMAYRDGLGGWGVPEPSKN